MAARLKNGYPAKDTDSNSFQHFHLKEKVQVRILGAPLIYSMADGTAWSGRLPVTQENQRGSLPLSVAKFC